MNYYIFELKFVHYHCEYNYSETIPGYIDYDSMLYFILINLSLI